MAEIYLNQRADECRILASMERDPSLVAVLHDLEQDYRLKAQRAMAVCRAH